MSVHNDFLEFFDMLIRATGKVEGHYFEVIAAGEEDSKYLERVYCYELYHRIREMMPLGYAYVLDGELDKAGNPLVRQNVGPRKPDFIVHVPREMGDNLAVMEVKSARASWNDIGKDLEVLNSFVTRAGYHRAIYLIYGEARRGIEPFRVALRELRDEVREDRVELVWHRTPGDEATVVEY